MLSRLRDAIHQKHPRLRWVLHMDNAPAHNARNTKLHMLFTGMQRIKHPPYSPDLAPSDFRFFSRVKKNLRGKHFDTLDDLEDAVDDEISSIAAYEYRQCMLYTWPMRWACCVFHNCGYFEGVH